MDMSKYAILKIPKIPQIKIMFYKNFKKNFKFLEMIGMKIGRIGYNQMKILCFLIMDI